MRVLVLLKLGGVSHRVLWASESRSGIYMGVFTDRVDTHFSYHADGVRHIRIAKSHHRRWRDVPLASHVGFKQLLHSSITLQSEPRPWPIQAPSARDEVLCLDESSFLGYDSLAVDMWLSDFASKAALGNTARGVHARHGFKYISHRVWHLQNFSGLLFAMGFWAASTSVPAAVDSGVGA